MPPLRRVLLAFLLACVAAAAVFSLAGTVATGSDFGPNFIVMLMGAAGVILVLGFPVYSLLVARFSPTLGKAAAAGALVGMAPALSLLLFAAFNTGRPVPLTAEAVGGFLNLMLLSALSGGVGGAVFWSCAYRRMGVARGGVNR